MKQIEFNWLYSNWYREIDSVLSVINNYRRVWVAVDGNESAAKEQGYAVHVIYSMQTLSIKMSIYCTKKICHHLSINHRSKHAKRQLPTTSLVSVDFSFFILYSQFVD